MPPVAYYTTFNINSGRKIIFSLTFIRMLAKHRMFKIIFVGFFALLYLHCVLSTDKPCGQHTLKVVYLRNCKGYQSTALQIQNFTISLTDDCRLVPRGCYVVKKKVSDITVNYHVSKPPMLNKNGTEDMCEALADSQFQSMAAPYKNIDSKCPIEAGKYCITKGNSLISQLNPSLLNMAVGTLKARLELISQKSKVKACVEVELVVSKRR